MSKRLTIHIEQHVYERLEKLRERLGFRSRGELVATLLGVLEKYIEYNDRRRYIQEDEDEITEMFNRLGQWEKTPDGIPPVRKHNRDNGKG